MESYCAEPEGIFFHRHRGIQVQDCIPEIAYNIGIADEAAHKHSTKRARKTRIYYNEVPLNQSMTAVKV